MAAVALTKIDHSPFGTIGGSKRAITDPAMSWYTAGAIADADTTAFSNWTGPNISNVIVIPSVSGEACHADFALSGGTLTITYQSDGAITAGAFVGIRR